MVCRNVHCHCHLLCVWVAPHKKLIQSQLYTSVALFPLKLGSTIFYHYCFYYPDADHMLIPEGYSRKEVQQTLSLTLNSELTYPVN